LVVEGLRHLLERDIDLVGAVEDGRAVLAAATSSSPTSSSSTSTASTPPAS